MKFSLNIKQKLKGRRNILCFLNKTQRIFESLEKSFSKEGLFQKINGETNFAIICIQISDIL